MYIGTCENFINNETRSYTILNNTRGQNQEFQKAIYCILFHQIVPAFLEKMTISFEICSNYFCVAMYSFSFSFKRKLPPTLIEQSITHSSVNI